MKDDTVMRLLRQVKSGKVSVEDARVALEDAALTEEAFEAAVNNMRIAGKSQRGTNFGL